MRLQKLILFQKLLDRGIKPTSEEFEKNVVSLLHEKIVESVDFNHVSPDTLAKVDQVAKNFKSDMKKLWTRSDVSMILF